MIARLLAIGLLPVAAAAGGAWAQSQDRRDAALPAADDCRYAEIQPSDVDFDDPRQRLGERVALDIPPGARIGEVRFDRREIFDLSDPDTDGSFYEWGNRLHVLTREGAIRAQLLFETGDAFSAEDLEETERALRGQPYLLDAWVQPYRVCGKRVDVVVVTRDLWTLRPDIGFSRGGGENKTSLGITDENFLGTGKQIEVNRETGPERDRTFVQYADPNILGSRWMGTALIADNSDGEEQALRIERPFYEFGATWAAGFDARRDDRIEEFFFRGDEVSEFRQETTTFGAFGGLSLGIDNETDTRLVFGYRYTDEAFGLSGVELPPPDPFPTDRTLSYPFIGLQVVENRFVETMNLDRIQRIEDVRDGIQFDARVGWSDTAYGADQDRLVLETEFRNAVVRYPGHLIDYALIQRGWFNADTDEFENLVLEYDVRYFNGGVNENTAWFARLNVAAAKNFTADRRFWLGGDSGLRGYPFRFQTGDRRVLFTVERRYYSDWHPFDLFRVGGVAFFDVGRAWFNDRDNGPNGGFLKDVGVGLRIASDRFETGKILHIDLAAPLDGGDDIDDVQFLVRGETTF